MGGGRRWGRKREKKGKNYATVRNISQSRKCKEAGANKYRAGTGRFEPPPPPTRNNDFYVVFSFSFLPSRIITYLLTGYNFVTPGRVIEVLRKGTRVYILSI